MAVDSISVIGLGKLGLPMAGCFAAGGFNVTGVDINPRVVDMVNAGQTPIYETGLDELVRASSERLSATVSTEEAVLASQATFLIVPTPSESEGDFSLRYVLDACEAIGQALRKKDEFHLVVVTSTVMPGATEGPIQATLEKASDKECGTDFGLCYSPEFIALGSVIHDFLNPDFLLVGESDERSGEMLQSIYAQVCQNQPSVSRMSFVNAELAKIAVNTFVTTKITFANMLAHICEQLPGAKVDVVTAAVGLDSRIGPKYLKGAIGYGGPCFPRDNIALTTLGHQIGAPMLLSEATDKANREEIRRLADLVQRKLPPSGTVGVLGLSYKPNTDVVEESQGLLLAQALIESGVPTVIYDPAALPNAVKELGEGARGTTSAAACIEASDVVIITTPWDEFKTIAPEIFERHSEPRVVIDCWRLLDRDKYENMVDYVPIGEHLEIQAK